MTVKRSFPLLVCTALVFGVLAAGCGGSSGSASAASFCSSFRSALAKFQDTRTAAQFQAAAAGLSQLESSAPSSIKADWQTVSDAATQVANTGGDTTALHTAAFTAADQRVTDWGNANCTK